MHSSPPHIHTTTHSKPLANASRSLHPHGYTTSNYSLVHKPHPAANRQTGGAGGGAEQLSSHTQGPGEREQRRAARALSQGLLQGLGSRPIRARVTRVRVTRVRATRVRVNRARVRFWHGVRVRVRVMARVSHAHSAHNPSNPS